MAEKVLERIIEPMIKSINFWRTYNGKRVRIVVDTSLQSFDITSYLDLKRTFIGTASEIVDFPSSIVLEDGEEITSQTVVSSFRLPPSEGEIMPLRRKPVVTDQDRVRFKRRAISLGSVKSIEVIEENKSE